MSLKVLSGNAPFSGLEASPMIRAICHHHERPPQLPLVSNTGASYAPLWAVAVRCWHRSPEARPALDDFHDLRSPVEGSTTVDLLDDDLPVLSSPSSTSFSSTRKRGRGGTYPYSVIPFEIMI